MTVLRNCFAQRQAVEDNQRLHHIPIVPGIDGSDGMPRRASVERKLYCGNSEPQLEDLLSDPIIHRMMIRDGVAMSALVGLIETVRRHVSRASDQSWP